MCVEQAGGYCRSVAYLLAVKQLRTAWLLIPLPSRPSHIADKMDLTRLADNTSCLVLRLDSGERWRHSQTLLCMLGCCCHMHMHLLVLLQAGCMQVPRGWQGYIPSLPPPPATAAASAAASQAPPIASSSLTNSHPVLPAEESAEAWYRQLQASQAAMDRLAGEEAALLPPDWEEASSTISGTDADEAALTAAQVRETERVVKAV